MKVIPFNLNTEQRNKQRERKSIQIDVNKDKHFKAKAMPTYNFFEPKRSESNVQRKLDFDEFNFKTTDRCLKKQESLKSQTSSSELDSATFKARKMPNFSC